MLDVKILRNNITVLQQNLSKWFGEIILTILFDKIHS